MRWLWVSRFAFDLQQQAHRDALEHKEREYQVLFRAYETTIADRDQHRDRGDRLADQLVDRFGFQPVSAPVRAELKAATEEFERTHAMEQYEDPGYGQIAEEFLEDPEAPLPS